MNPFGLDATGLMVWGLVAHLIADWLLQNDWMANHKAERLSPRVGWGIRHPAAFVHAGIHGALLALVFGWVALPLAVAHLLIDTRKPVAWWSALIRQTQPEGVWVTKQGEGYAKPVPVVDIGMFVRFWNDQVWHIGCIAIAALVVAA